MIYFIGIHHKGNLPALCSTTRSGKKVDVVINLLNRKCEKTNLFSSDCIPTDKTEYEKQLRTFLDRTKDGDTLVLLGKDVQRHFPLYLLKRKVRIVGFRHPAFSGGSWSNDLFSLLISPNVEALPFVQHRITKLQKLNTDE